MDNFSIPPSRITFLRTPSQLTPKNDRFQIFPYQNGKARTRRVRGRTIRPGETAAIESRMDPNHDCTEEIRKEQRADLNRLMRENTIPELDPVDSTPTNPTVPTTLPPTVTSDPVDSTPTTAMTPDHTDP